MKECKIDEKSIIKNLQSILYNQFECASISYLKYSFAGDLVSLQLYLDVLSHLNVQYSVFQVLLQFVHGRVNVKLLAA